MKAPKTPFEVSKPVKSAKTPAQKKPTPKRIPLAQKRAVRREAKRFTHENRFKKIFLRSLVSSVAALMVLVLATMFTPLMAIEKITVSGNQNTSTKQILAALKHRIGSPLPMLSEADVAKDLEKFKVIESVSLLSQPPNKVEVRITERTAIAIVIRSGVSYLYDPAGVNLGRVKVNPAIPTILVNDDPKTSENYKQAIDVLLALPAQLLKRVSYIQAKSRDNVTMQLRGVATQTIIWGDSSDSILKSKVLKALLLKTPPSVRATFDVSSPLTPSVIR
jgi:cell division protein FtsQ